MSCWHHYGHSCDWPPPPELYDAYRYRRPRYVDELPGYREDELEADEDRPRRRRGSGRREGRRYESVPSEEVTAASLLSRADALREELGRIEEGLKQLSSESEPSTET
jgi:hypothetical protein